MLSSQWQFSQSHQERVISLAANRWTEMSVHIQEEARDPRNWPMHDFRALWTAPSIPFFLIKHSHVLMYSFPFKIRCKRNWWEPVYFFFLRKMAGNSRDDRGSLLQEVAAREGGTHPGRWGWKGAAPARGTELGFKDNGAQCRQGREPQAPLS